MRRTKEEALQTKLDLMDKALELFIRKGFSKISQEDIVKKLGLTRGAFNWHFNDKEDIFKAIHTREFRFMKELIAGCFSEEGGEEQQLQRLLHNIVSNFYENKRFRNVIELTWFRIEVEENSFVMREKRSLNEFFINGVNDILKKAKRKGVLKGKINTLETALSVTAFLLGIYRLYFVTPDYLKNKQTAIRMAEDFVERIFA